MASGFVESTSEAVRGGVQAIKKIRGLLTEVKLSPPPYTDSTYGEPKRVIDFTLEEAQILEMFPGEEAFDLKDNTFRGRVTYAVEGKTPSANTAYMKVWVASAEKLGKKPSEFVGQYVTLDKPRVPLFKMAIDPKEVRSDTVYVLDAEGNKIIDKNGKVKVELYSTNTFAFVADESADTGSVKEKVKAALVGLSEKAALRHLVIDFKQYPEYKDAYNTGKLCDILGLKVVDGLYVNSN